MRTWEDIRDCLFTRAILDDVMSQNELTTDLNNIQGMHSVRSPYGLLFRLCSECRTNSLVGHTTFHPFEAIA